MAEADELRAAQGTAVSELRKQLAEAQRDAAVLRSQQEPLNAEVEAARHVSLPSLLFLSSYTCVVCFVIHFLSPLQTIAQQQADVASLRQDLQSVKASLAAAVDKVHTSELLCCEQIMELLY